VYYDRPSFLPQYPLGFRGSHAPYTYSLYHPIPALDNGLEYTRETQSILIFEKRTFYYGIGWQLLNEAPFFVGVKVKMQRVNRSRKNKSK
jgi:hypothetical protein